MKKLLTLTLALVIALTSFTTVSFAKADDYDFKLGMMVKDLDQEIVPDEEFDVLVYASTYAIDTYTYQIGIEFDPQYFQFVEAKALNKDAIYGIESFDNKKGTATFAHYINGEDLYENEDNYEIYELCVVTFKTVKKVNKNLTFKFDDKATKFLDEDGKEISMETEKLEIEIPEVPTKDRPQSVYFSQGDTFVLDCETDDVEYYFSTDEDDYPDELAVNGKISLPKSNVEYFVIARKYGIDSDIAEFEFYFQKTYSSPMGGGGGGYVSNNTSVTTPSTNAGQNEKYSDIKGHWAESFIKNLIDKKIINGYEDGTVKPGNTITRAEVAKMIVCALGQGETTPNLEFKDADTIADWAAGYIQTAVNLGILNGYEDNTFKPAQPITRQELAKIAMVAFKMGESDKELTFTDNAKIPDWSRKYVASAVDNGIITGYPDGTFLPENNVTRAEACTIISKCLK